MDDYRVKSVAPDMTEADFLRVLREGNSPVPVGAARAVYSYALARRLSPAYLLAMFWMESKFGREGKAALTYSWGNTTEPSFGVPGVGVIGRFTDYANWADGGVSTVARHFDHVSYKSLATVREIIPVWAPKSENDTENYIRVVLAQIARYASPDAPGATKGTSMTPQPPINTEHPSPNRGYPTGTHRPEAICWHITQGTNSLPWLTNPASKASSNYLIARNGTIYELVPPGESAWANGAVCAPDTTNPLIAAWRREGVNFNQRTISIEHEGKTSNGKGGSLTHPQIEATIALTAWLCATFGIAPDQTHILGHYEIDACNRPNCPGFSGVEWTEWVKRVAAQATPTTPSGLPTLEPVITEQVNWGGRGRLVRQTVVVVNEDDPQHPVYYENTKEYEATGPVVKGWKEI